MEIVFLQNGETQGIGSHIIAQRMYIEDKKVALLLIERGVVKKARKPREVAADGGK